MSIISKVIGVDSKVVYFTKHLSIINPILPVQLTEKEIAVLANFMALDKVLIEDDMFNTIARKKVMDSLKISDGGLGNYLRSMIKKTFLQKSEITGRITVQDFLSPEANNQGYQFKIQFNEDSDEENRENHKID